MVNKDKDLELVEQIIRRHKKLEDERYPHEPIWDEVAYFGCSRRPDFKKQQQKGIKQGTQIYDGTPAAALNLYVDGIQGYHISRALEWFSYRIGGYRLKSLNENRDVRLWLQNMKEAVYWELASSNFYDAMREYLLDGASIGNANMFIDEDIANNVLTFLVRHPREIWFSENHLGEIDLIHRKFEKNPRQAVQDFGYDNVSLNIQKAYDNDQLNRTFEFIQAIYPIDDWLVKEFDSEAKKLKKFKRYVSYYIEVDQKKLLRRGGFKILNPIIWRMKKYSGETYGRGLLGDAISEVKRLNSASKTEMQIAQLSAEPALNVPFEMKDEVDMSPLGQNYYRDAGRIIQPINTGANYPITEDYIQRLQSAIERHFQVEFFLMLARSEGTMTATEIIEKQGEKVALMTSQLGQLSVNLNRIHNRILNLMFAQGKLPPIPDILIAATGGFFNIDVDYVGPLAEAQKRLFKARGIRQSLEVAAPYIQMFPGILDTLDDVELAKELFLTHGMPAQVMRSDEAIAEIRNTRAKMQQQQFEAELAETQAKTAQKIQKPVEEGSIMEKMIGE